MDFFKPSNVVTSAPAGGGIKYPLTIIIPILTTLPIIRPAKNAKIFLRIGFICF
jgi:hypothetical protein